MRCLRHLQQTLFAEVVPRYRFTHGCRETKTNGVQLARALTVYICQTLINQKAQIDSRREDNLSPLAIAISYGHIKSARVLLEGKADVNMRCPVQVCECNLDTSSGDSTQISARVVAVCMPESSQEQWELVVFPIVYCDCFIYNVMHKRRRAHV